MIANCALHPPDPDLPPEPALGSSTIGYITGSISKVDPELITSAFVSAAGLIEIPSTLPPGSSLDDALRLIGQGFVAASAVFSQFADSVSGIPDAPSVALQSVIAKDASAVASETLDIGNGLIAGILSDSPYSELGNSLRELSGDLKQIGNPDIDAALWALSNAATLSEALGGWADSLLPYNWYPYLVGIEDLSQSFYEFGTQSNSPIGVTLAQPCTSCPEPGTLGVLAISLAAFAATRANAPRPPPTRNNHTLNG